MTRVFFSGLLLPFAIMTAGAQEKDAKPAAHRTALIHDDFFLEHDTGPGFPEKPDRLRMLTKHLKEHPVSGRLLWLKPNEKIDALPWILEMHNEEYVRELKRACESADGHSRLGADNPISKRTYDVAVMAVNGALTAVD